jgi:hypothetical protein
MFNEQGCRIGARIAPTALLRRTIFEKDCAVKPKPRWHGDDLAMAIKRTKSLLVAEEIARANIIAPLFRRHFFRFVPV